MERYRSELHDKQLVAWLLLHVAQVDSQAAQVLDPVRYFPSGHVKQFVADPEQVKHEESHERHEFDPDKYFPLAQVKQFVSNDYEQVRQVLWH